MKSRPRDLALARLLLALARGGTLEEAAWQAGLSVEEATLLVSALVSEGYLERLPQPSTTGCPCERCPFRLICGGRRGPGVYALTDKGRRLLSTLLSRGETRGGTSGRPGGGDSRGGSPPREAG